MKKVFLLAGLALFSHFSNGQTKENLSDSALDTATLVNKISTLEQRLISQEQEVENLKKENSSLKKQLRRIRNVAVFGGGTRTVVQRKGSKQWTTE